MKEDWNRLTRWVIHTIETRYPRDVALLLAVDGAEVDGDGHGAAFDYFIPATPAGGALARDFILGDRIGCDLYPRTWERTERTADLEESPFCVSAARILWSRTPEDAQRFLALQARQKAHLQDRAFMYAKSREKLEAAMELYRTMQFEDALCKVRLAAGYLCRFIKEAAAYENGRILDAHTDGALRECACLPENFRGLTASAAAAKTVEELRGSAWLLLRSFRRFLEARAPAEETPKQRVSDRELADWYAELSLTMRRLSCRCAGGDAEKALEDACLLQVEFQDMQASFGLADMDLLSAFDSRNLAAVDARCAYLAREMEAVLAARGTAIDRWESLDAFLKAN